jgi:hypothetical protein
MLPAGGERDQLLPLLAGLRLPGKVDADDVLVPVSPKPHLAHVGREAADAPYA